MLWTGISDTTYYCKPDSNIVNVYIQYQCHIRGGTKVWTRKHLLYNNLLFTYFI